MQRLFVLALLLIHGAAWAAEPPARVVLIGTNHFSNPGQDQANVESVDVTVPKRQAELQAVTDALAAFKPTFVGVEWPAEAARAQYAQYLDGALPPSRNEVVQLGFRLARQAGLEQVHGLDVPGDFPFEPLSAWANAHGKSADLQALMAQAQGITTRITALQTTRSIGGVPAVGAGRGSRGRHRIPARFLSRVGRGRRAGMLAASCRPEIALGHTESLQHPARALARRLGRALRGGPVGTRGHGIHDLADVLRGIRLPRQGRRLVRLDPRIRGDAAAGVDRAQDVPGRMARDCPPPRGAATAVRLGAPGLLGAVATCLSVPPSTTTIGRRPCSRAPARLRHRLIGCRRA